MIVTLNEKGCRVKTKGVPEVLFVEFGLDVAEWILGAGVQDGNARSVDIDNGDCTLACERRVFYVYVMDHVLLVKLLDDELACIVVPNTTNSLNLGKV